MRFSSWAGAISAYYPPAGDPDVSNWAGRVASAGGSVSAGQLAAITAFVEGLKTDGLWTKIQRLNPFVGEQLAAALIPLVNTLGDVADTNVNLVSGDFSATLGLMSDASTKYLTTGAQPASFTCGLTAYISTLTSGSGTRYAMGESSGSGDITRLWRVGNTNYAGQISANVGISIAAQIPVGLLHAERRSSTDFELYQAGASVGTDATAEGTPTPTLPLFVLASNQNGSPSGFYTTNAYIGGYSITDGTMDDTDAANYSARWATLRGAL